MNGGSCLFALFFLLAVNLSLFTEVDSSFIERPSWKRPIRSVPDHGFRARRYAAGMDSILAPMDNEDTRRG
uniref:Uncharacterized protein n=1 Tax=Meloidogyne incognita TaxID=6306 RepID=A0A914KH33_MELIC